MTTPVFAMGEASPQQTLQIMVRVARESLLVPTVVEWAHKVTLQCPPRNYPSIANAVRDWMAYNFRFVADPVGVELVRTPLYMLERFAKTGMTTGDCDDAAVMAASLALAVGVPAAYFAVGYQANRQVTHVYTVLYPSGGEPVRVDVTRPYGAPEYQETACLVCTV